MVFGVYSFWIIFGVLATTHGTSTRRDECTAYEGSERLAVLFKRLVQRIRTVTRRRSVVRAKSSGSDSDRESRRVGLSWVALSWVYTREQSVVVPHLFTNTKNLISACLSAKPAAVRYRFLDRLRSNRIRSDRFWIQGAGVVYAILLAGMGVIISGAWLSKKQFVYNPDVLTGIGIEQTGWSIFTCTFQEK